jgi:predicted DNA-binding transcriptional regulator AlpA
MSQLTALEPPNLAQVSSVRQRTPPGSPPKPPTLTTSGFGDVPGGEGELINARQLATLLKLSRASLYRLKSARKLPRELRIGRRGVRWLRSEIEWWLRMGGPDQDGWDDIRGPLGFGPGGGK